MYSKMSLKDKINYYWKKNNIIISLFLVVFICSVLVCIFEEGSILENFWGLILIGISLVIIVFLIIRLFYPINIFSKNLEITDGYIDKIVSHSKGNSGVDYYATAKTSDGSKCTKEEWIPFWFRHGKIPVKIILYKNQARYFIIAKESYAYVEEHRGEIEKKVDNNSKIIGIFLLILIMIIMAVVLLIVL